MIKNFLVNILQHLDHTTLGPTSSSLYSLRIISSSIDLVSLSLSGGHTVENAPCRGKKAISPSCHVHKGTNAVTTLHQSYIIAVRPYLFFSRNLCGKICPSVSVRACLLPFCFFPLLIDIRRAGSKTRSQKHLPLLPRCDQKETRFFFFLHF